MDIYYRGFDSNSPISSGAKHLTACAARLLLAMLRSIQYMDDAAIEAFHKYISVDNIWLLCLMLAGWLLAAVVGGTIGAAVGAILAFLGYVFVYLVPEHLSAIQDGYERNAASLEKSVDKLVSSHEKDRALWLELINSRGPLRP